MADQKRDTLVEDAGPGNSGWSQRGGADSQWMHPTGRMGRYLSKFFATTAQKAVADYDSIAGDAVINPERPIAKRPPFMTMHRSELPFLPELELNRKRRYQEYEKMDDYPEVTAAFDIYSDESTQKDIRKRRWIVTSESTVVVKEVNRLFQRIKLHKVYWDIVRNCVKFGDCFVESILDINKPKNGFKRIKILNPNYIIRVEDAMGYLEKFLQEIPDRNSWDVGVEVQDNNKKYATLDRNQIIHFRLHTSDPKFYPYGKGIAAGAVRIFRSLQLMEEAMIVYRITRAPERRIFYVDVGRLNASKAEAFIEEIKEKYKKEKFVTNGNIDGRYNPLAPDEDYFVPTHENGRGTKIETLPGAQNLGEVDDVKYFRDKLLATLKIPKDYIAEFDKSPERKANLAQLDVKFARTIIRIQDAVTVGLEALAKRHLKLRGYPQSLINKLSIELPDPSDIFTKRKMEIDEQKARVVQAEVGTGLFPMSHIYKSHYDLTDAEIEGIKEELAKEQEEQMAQEAKQASVMNSMGGGPSDGPGGEMPALSNPPPPTSVGAPGEGAQPRRKPKAKQATAEDLDIVLTHLNHKYGNKKNNHRLVETISSRFEEK